MPGIKQNTYMNKDLFLKIILFASTVVLLVASSAKRRKIQV